MTFRRNASKDRLPELNNRRGSKSVHVASGDFTIQKSGSQLPKYNPEKDPHMKEYLARKKMIQNLQQGRYTIDQIVRQMDRQTAKKLPKLYLKNHKSSLTTRRKLQVCAISKQQFDTYISAMKTKLQVQGN